MCRHFMVKHNTWVIEHRNTSQWISSRSEMWYVLQRSPGRILVSGLFRLSLKFILQIFILQKVPQVIGTHKLFYLLVKSYLLLPHKAIKIALWVQFSDAEDCHSFDLLPFACSIWGLSICILLQARYWPDLTAHESSKKDETTSFFHR